jgi:transcriptional regulator with XRE-family HTH domain
MNKRRAFTTVELKETEKLREIWDKKSAAMGLTQADASKEFGFANQSAVSQYLNGRIPLNIEIALKFAKYLNVPVSAISERAAALSGSPEKDAKRAMLGIPMHDDLIEATPDMRRMSGGADFIVIDKDDTAIGNGLYLAGIGGKEALLKIEIDGDDITIAGVSDAPMTIPLQASGLISIKGKVTHKIIKC